MENSKKRQNPVSTEELQDQIVAEEGLLGKSSPMATRRMRTQSNGE